MQSVFSSSRQPIGESAAFTSLSLFEASGWPSPSVMHRIREIGCSWTCDGGHIAYLHSRAKLILSTWFGRRARKDFLEPRDTSSRGKGKPQLTSFVWDCQWSCTTDLQCRPLVSTLPIFGSPRSPLKSELSFRGELFVRDRNICMNGKPRVRGAPPGSPPFKSRQHGAKQGGGVARYATNVSIS